MTTLPQPHILSVGDITITPAISNGDLHSLGSVTIALSVPRDRICPCNA